jgi:exopolysaccharide biosynthesis polyprenyl glycosylphosphotransferase
MTGASSAGLQNEWSELWAQYGGAAEGESVVFIEQTPGVREVFRYASEEETVPVDPALAERGSVLRRLLLTLDVIGLAGVWLTAWTLFGPRASTASTVACGAAAVAVGIGVAITQALYSTRINQMRVVAFTRLARAAAASAAASWVALVEVHSSKDLDMPIIGGLAAFAVTAMGRYCFDFWLCKRREAGHNMRPVVVVGSAREAGKVISYLRDHPKLGWDPVAGAGDHNSFDRLDVPWLGGVADAIDVITQTGATGALVVCSGMPSDELNAVIRDLLECGIHVHLSSGLTGLNYRRVQSVPVGHEPFLYLVPTSLNRPQKLCKRSLDIAVASFIVLLTAPVLAVSAIAIKLTDRGPVFFRQTRVGRGGEHFTVLKLRTMCTDAEARLDEVKALNERSGPLFKMEHDPRVTRVGRTLRATSIDELPQLFNVLSGRMSLVGPRPALPDEVATFDAELLGRLQVRPGITGLWQVEARDNPSFDSYRRLDLFYVENWSLLLDIVVLIDTVPAVIERAVKVLRGIGRAAAVVPVVADEIDLTDGTLAAASPAEIAS